MRVGEVSFRKRFPITTFVLGLPYVLLDYVLTQFEFNFDLLLDDGAFDNPYTFSVVHNKKSSGLALARVELTCLDSRGYISGYLF